MEDITKVATVVPAATYLTTGGATGFVLLRMGGSGGGGGLTGGGAGGYNSGYGNSGSAGTQGQGVQLWDENCAVAPMPVVEAAGIMVEAWRGQASVPVEAAGWLIMGFGCCNRCGFLGWLSGG